jgi:hypothetical protein
MTSADDSFLEVWGLLTDRAFAARDRLTQLREDVTREVEHRPFRTLALAAGAGYLLAGGLFSRLTLRVISLGTRLAILPLIAAEIAAAREDSSETSTHRPHSRRPRSRHDLAEPQA